MGMSEPFEMSGPGESANYRLLLPHIIGELYHIDTVHTYMYTYVHTYNVDL